MDHFVAPSGMRFRDDLSFGSSYFGDYDEAIVIENRRERTICRAVVGQYPAADYRLWSAERRETAGRRGDVGRRLASDYPHADTGGMLPACTV